jgi:hypothetical protein
VDVQAHLGEPEDLPEFLKEPPVAGLLWIILKIDSLTSAL